LRDWIAPIRDAHGSADKCECLNVIDSCAAIARDAVREYDTAREGK
jgi:hypothetical protein